MSAPAKTPQNTEVIGPADDERMGRIERPDTDEEEMAEFLAVFALFRSLA